jgi:hypothetical protein
MSTRRYASGSEKRKTRKPSRWIDRIAKEELWTDFFFKKYKHAQKSRWVGIVVVEEQTNINLEDEVKYVNIILSEFVLICY